MTKIQKVYFIIVLIALVFSLMLLINSRNNSLAGIAIIEMTYDAKR